MSSSDRPSDDGSFTREVGTQTGKAVVLILVVVVVAVVLLQHRTTTTTTTPKPAVSATPPPPSVTTSTTSALIPPAQIKLVVLNGTLKGNLASQFTTKLKASPGYNTTVADNTTTAVQGSMVIAVTPQYLPEADALAVQLGLPPTAVVNGVPANAPIHTSEETIGNLILIVGSDLASQS